MTLIDPPFTINPYFGMDKYEKMRKKAMDKCAEQEHSRFFKPGVINIFTDASMKNGTDVATMANAITTSSPFYGTMSIVSNINYIKADTILEAEADAILYGLISYNANLTGGNQVNIFIDSIGCVNLLKDKLNLLNSDINTQKELISELSRKKDSSDMNELLYMICMERTYINCPVNIYHIKAHTKDIMLIRTMFSQFNGFDISVKDAIELSNYNCIIDSKVSKYSRCPEDFDRN